MSYYVANVSPYKSSIYMNHFDSQPLVVNYTNIYSIVLSLIICIIAIMVEAHTVHCLYATASPTRKICKWSTH